MEIKPLMKEVAVMTSKKNLLLIPKVSGIGPETKKEEKRDLSELSIIISFLVFKRLMICSFSLSGKWNENSRFSLMTEEENAIEK
jgi:hypothetical protein